MEYGGNRIPLYVSKEYMSVTLCLSLCALQFYPDHEYASAQFLDFLELAENCTFLDRKLISALNETVDGH